MTLSSKKKLKTLISRYKCFCRQGNVQFLQFIIHTWSCEGCKLNIFHFSGSERRQTQLHPLVVSPHHHGLLSYGKIIFSHPLSHSSRNQTGKKNWEKNISTNKVVKEHVIKVNAKEKASNFCLIIFKQNLGFCQTGQYIQFRKWPKVSNAFNFNNVKHHDNLVPLVRCYTCVLNMFREIILK